MKKQSKGRTRQKGESKEGERWRRAKSNGNAGEEHTVAKDIRRSWNQDEPMMIAVAATSIEDARIEGEERMESELQPFFRRGALPRRLFVQPQTWSAAETRPMAGKLLMPPSSERERGEGVGGDEESSQGGGGGEEALGEAEQQSRAAEEELREYLHRDAHSTSLTDLLNEVVARGSGVLRVAREGPEGVATAPVWQKPTIPPEYQAEHPPAR